MQDLVGVRVADAAQQLRIGQRALERVVALREPLRERRKVEWRDLESAAIVLGERRFAVDDVERRAALAARLGQRQRSRCKLERCEHRPSRTFRTRLVPVQPAGDHEVQDQPEIACEADRDTLAEPPQCDDVASRAILR